MLTEQDNRMFIVLFIYFFAFSFLFFFNRYQMYGADCAHPGYRGLCCGETSLVKCGGSDGGVSREGVRCVCVCLCLMGKENT